jgi:hypothetical protein
VSETLKKVKLDAVLREWPEAEKSAMDWEQMAQRIDDHVQSGDAIGAPEGVSYVSDENLFAGPLGQIEGEGHNSAARDRATVKTVQPRVSKGETMTMPVDRERDRRSLQDLAKMATGGMTPPPPSVSAPHSSAPSGVVRAADSSKSKEDDSGIVDLAMAAQSDPQGALRAQTTPLAKDGLFDDEPASIRPGPVSQSPISQQLQQPAPSMPPFSPASSPSSVGPASLAPISQMPASAPALAPASFVPSSAVAQQGAQAGTPTKKKGGIVIPLLFAAVAISAVAAGGFFFMKHRVETAAAQLALNTAPPPAPVAVTTPPQPAETANAAPAPEPSLDPNALPAATDDKLAAAKAGAPKTSALSGAAVAKNDKPVAPAKPEETAKLSQKDLPTAPVGPEGDLGKAMGKAVGADGKPIDPTPAAGNTNPQFAAGTVPQKPSQGAVTGAIGAVLPGARACLGPDDPVSRAAITFNSAGSVSSVNVSGGAAGKPAEACIKGALGKAKLAPFAEPTYTANITVRH